MSRYLFRLYLNADPESSDRARQIRDLVAQMIREGVPADHELQVINVLTEPERAAEDGILATPTLARIEPPPVQQVVGNVVEPGQVLPALDLARPPTESD